MVADAGADGGFDAGASAREPDNVLALPDDPMGPEDITDEQRLRALLLRDPRQAERHLVALTTPDQWQVALLAQLALRRGQRAPGALSEDSRIALPPPPIVTGAGRAWVWVSEAVLWGAAGKRSRSPQAVLPLGTPVEVLALDGGTATVAVELATTAEYGAVSEVEPGLPNEPPVRVETTRLEGSVELRQLGAEAPDANAVIDLAEREADDERAAGLWLRAFQLEPSEHARRGLLEVAWRARRPALVATAALMHATAPARSLTLAWGCTGEPAGAQWERWPLRRNPKGTVCVTGVDARTSCPHDSEGRRNGVADATAAREALGLTERPLLRLVVDGRTARRILLTSARLEAVDPCADFEEVKVAGWGASIRRLAVPLGAQRLTLLVPVQTAVGVEHAVIAAPSEAKAAAWLRSRSHLRWTIGRAGELEPSLRTGDPGFRLEPDVIAATWAEPPARSCECE